MKDTRLKQIKESDGGAKERELRNKIQHLETELSILGEETEPDEIIAKQGFLEVYQDELAKIEESKPTALEVVFEGRITIRLSDSDGFYLYSEVDGNIDKGEYWSNDWGVLRTSPLLDSEVQVVMDYFNIDDVTYSTYKA
jgi:hypothetical protein